MNRLPTSAHEGLEDLCRSILEPEVPAGGISWLLSDLATEGFCQVRLCLPARLRLWMPLQFLNAWAMAVAGQQGFFGPSHAGFDSRIAAWAEEQFWLYIEDLP